MYEEVLKDMQYMKVCLEQAEEALKEYTEKKQECKKHTLCQDCKHYGCCREMKVPSKAFVNDNVRNVARKGFLVASKIERM